MSRSLPFRTACWQVVSLYLRKAFATVSALLAQGMHEPPLLVRQWALRTSFRWENFCNITCTAHTNNHSPLRPIRRSHAVLFTARRYTSVVYAVVCLSVCHKPGTVPKRLNIESRKLLHDSPETLVKTSFLIPKILAKFQQGHLQRGRQIDVGRLLSAIF